MNARRGFTLIELLVALAVFATMAALAYGGLNSIAKTRGELANQEDRFRDLMRAVDVLSRDLSESAARPVRGTSGQQLRAFIGTADNIEFTRLGFANPQAEQRSNLERVMYELDANELKRGRFAVLDRAPDTLPTISDLHVALDALRLQYLTADGHWLDAWPPPQTTDITLLPRAVQWHFVTRGDGEITGTIELVSAWPQQAPISATSASTTTPTTPFTPVTPVTPIKP